VLVLVPRSAEPRYLVLQDVGSDQQTDLDSQALQRVLHQGQQLVPIQGELDLPAGVLVLGSALGRLRLASGLSVRIGSVQGGSSSKGVKRTSSLTAGREEPPLSFFNYPRDTLWFIAGACSTLGSTHANAPHNDAEADVGYCSSSINLLGNS